MCGIVGFINLNCADEINPLLLDRMCRSITHRGPDDEGAYIDEGFVGMAMRRLSIIDLAGGHQPIANEDGTVWVVYNGEIYNFKELMDDLTKRGHKFLTRSDTEVIVHAYEEYGLDCLQRFNGMFAIALWDKRQKRLLLARDPFGIKPLYIKEGTRRLFFGSEIKSFMADPTFRCEVDLVSLDAYLTFEFVPSPGTIFKGVQKLRPGHAVLIEKGQVQHFPFIDQDGICPGTPSEGEALEALRSELVKAVKRHMISDVPVGALMSGGLDSATVVAIMQEVTGRQIKSFTVGFEGEFDKNELVAAQRTASILGTEHHQVVLSAKKCMEVFPKVMWHMDEPIATPSALAMFYVSQLASEHVKVVLTGQGADEPWAGYRRYRGEKWGEWYRRIPGFVRHHAVAPLVSILPRGEAIKRAVYALDNDDPVDRFTGVYTVFTQEMKQKLYRNNLFESSVSTLPRDSVHYWQKNVESLVPLAQQLYVETRLSLSDNWLIYGDKMSMAASLEARVPLLDLELMKFVENLPVDLRLKGWSGHKYLFRKAIRHWLPDEILRRPKIGFKTPVDQWFQREMYQVVRDRICSPDSACARFFNIGYINDLVELHKDRKKDYTRHLFSLLAFEVWHDQFKSRMGNKEEGISG